MISVGIDVSKEKSMICILKPYGEMLVSLCEILHTESSVNDLIAKIKSYGEEIRVIMEATGAYHLPLLTRFVEADIFLSVINPLVMKKYASAAIRKGKTDKLDSVRIANYGLDNWFHLVAYQPAEAVYTELNILGRQYSHYVKMRIEGKLVLTNLLDRTMPGIKTLLSGKRSDMPTKDKLCDFVAKFWHFDKITKMSENKFIASYSKWAKEKEYHQSESKAKAIYALSQNGIPTLSSNAPSTKMLVLEAIRVLQEINKTLELILTPNQVLDNYLSILF